MEVVNIVCPVCTLYLRPGITLKQHLTSHPKQKVIEALVRLSESEETQKQPTEVTPAPSAPSVISQPWGHVPIGPAGPMHGNHVFIYQQSMSTTAPHQGNVISPLNQQYVIPAVFNPQMMPSMMPYVYQQQQVIMSSNTGIPPHIRALPFEVPTSTQISEISEKPKEVSSDEENLVVNDVIQEEPERILTPSVEEHQPLEIQEEISVEVNVQDSMSSDIRSPIKKQEVEEDSIECSEEIGLNKEDDFCNSKCDYEVERGEEEVVENNDIDHEECIGTPMSSVHSEWGFHSELNKACQTQTNNGNTSPAHDAPEIITEAEIEHEISNKGDEHSQPNNQQNYYYFDQPYEGVYTTTIENSYEQSDPIYTSANILHANDPIDFVNMEDIEGMQVIINEFPGAPVISEVKNFEHTRPERPGVLMMIGEMSNSKNINNFEEHRDESLSRESSNVNIRADERMPARGELSGQESIGGASDITWHKVSYQDQGSSGTSNSYDLLARESWGEDSNSMIVDNNSAAIVQSAVPFRESDDVPVVVGYSGPPLNFKCSLCEDAFASVKERKEHEMDVHSKKPNIVGLDIRSERKPKKLIIKPKKKPPETIVEDKFGNTFTNRLKVEETTTKEEEVSMKENILEGTVIKTDESGATHIKCICYFCTTIFDSKRDLRLHLLEQHKSSALSRNKCQTCGEIFANEYKYTDHLRIHPLECKLCGKLFYRKQNIQLHIKRHLGLKPFKCELCPKAFITKQKLEEHRNIHTGNAPIKCTLCPETFRRHSNMVQHRNRRHTTAFKKKVRDYICQCGEIFHSKKKLAWHKEIHDPKPKACTQCSEKFVHMASLTRHMRRAHNAEFLPEERKHLNVNAECPVCKGTFLRSSMDAHLRVHNGQRPYTCLICNKDFTTKWNLKLHKWTHASRTQKPFKCDQCKGAFIRESDYVAHMNSHKSVRPYTCNYCGAQFIRKYNCQRHVKEHENTKTHSCNVCGKTFHRSYYLKDHLRVHSGVRPYSCHICGKTSTTKSNHNKHVQIHHAREPVSTEN